MIRTPSSKSFNVVHNACAYDTIIIQIENIIIITEIVGKIVKNIFFQQSLELQYNVCRKKIENIVYRK